MDRPPRQEHNNLMDHVADLPQTAKKERPVSASVRKALTLYVEEGYTWAEAAKAAGLSEAGIHKARQRQNVQEALQEIEVAYIQRVEAARAPVKALAFEVGKRLMTGAKSEAVRARMVEFFAGSQRNQGVSVAVQVNNMGQNGYEYARPGTQIVEIKGSTDTVSGEQLAETPDNKGEKS